MKLEDHRFHHRFKNLSELIANQVVEGFISGMHKSPSRIL
jgi:hypothetical protein